jgi:hypothetical protein
MRIIAIAILALVPMWVGAQNRTQQTGQPPIPSKEEVTALLNKADAAVRAFDQVLAGAKPALDKQDPGLFQKYTQAAKTTKEIIQALEETSPSAYGLVGLITTLDDVTLNASRAATVILLGRGAKGDKESDRVVAELGSAQNGCYEASERITNATLRLIQVEEKVLMERVEQDPK